jgi:formiminoglutamase
MHLLEIFTKKDLNTILRKREGETKIGETIKFCENEKWENELKKSKAQFVIFGIPEDIGVRANFGRGGAHTAFKPALDSFINQQNNNYLLGENCFVLGHIFVNDLMESSNSLNSKNKPEVIELRKLVDVIDERVTHVVSSIIKLNKTPIIIGGGHNNAYGNIKGCSIALNQKINVINCDPHCDIRALDGRHSGNGFSYALQNNYLNKYAVFGLHEQYNNTNSLNQFIQNSNLFFSSFEDIFIREKTDFKTSLQRCINFISDNKCGIEIDLDAITNVPSSAKTSSGISQLQARQFVYQCANNLKPLYLHIAEGAPILSHIKADNKTGKLIAYLISDFIKGCLENEN